LLPIRGDRQKTTDLEVAAWHRRFESSGRSQHIEDQKVTGAAFGRLRRTAPHVCCNDHRGACDFLLVARRTVETCARCRLVLARLGFSNRHHQTARCRRRRIVSGGSTRTPKAIGPGTQRWARRRETSSAAPLPCVRDEPRRTKARALHPAQMLSVGGVP